jgi:hypothetical protein
MQRRTVRGEARVSNCTSNSEAIRSSPQVRFTVAISATNRCTLGIPRATWLTFTRTCSSWAHENGVPGKVVVELMGHATVDTTLNVYPQVIDGSKRGGGCAGRTRIVRDCSQAGRKAGTRSLNFE